MQHVPLSNPDITAREIEAVVDVLKTPNLSLGPKLVEFENAVAEFAGVRNAVAVNSGTSALHLIVRSLGIKDSDEVITSPFSFVASANCMLFERAKPVFADIDENTLNINENLIEGVLTDRTKAILPVHIFGHPCNMDKILALAKKHGLDVFEDACEAIGAEYKGRKVGTFGKAATFAFYPNKQITTGEGGVIVTDSDDLAEHCRSMANQGRGNSGEWLNHVRLGYNYRMPEASAVLGLVQVQRLPEILAKRDIVAAVYKDCLGDCAEVRLPFVDADVKMSWFVYVIRLQGKIARRRNEVMDSLRKLGVQCRDYFSPIHLQPYMAEAFGFKKGDFPVAEKVAQETIALPFYSNLQKEQVEYVCTSLKRIILDLS